MAELEPFKKQGLDVPLGARPAGRALAGHHYEIPLSPQAREVSNSHEYKALEELVRTKNLPDDLQEQTELDLHYYILHNEKAKVGVLRNLLSLAQNKPHLLHRTLISLRRVENEQIPQEPVGSLSGVIRNINTQAERNMQRFYSDYDALPVSWNLFFDEYDIEQSKFAEFLCRDLKIKARTRTKRKKDGFTDTYVVPFGLRKYRYPESGGFEDYYPAIAHFLYEKVTERYPAYKIERLHHSYLNETRVAEKMDEWKRVGKENKSIAQNLWDFVLAKAGEKDGKRILLWLNESTGPRYFGRDEADPGFALQHGIAQDINDREVILTLGRHREMLRHVAGKIRAGKKLSGYEQSFVRFLESQFNMSDSTRVLPIHELKIKSSNYEHEGLNTIKVFENIIDTAEVLGMDIVFVDVSGQIIGRSQANAQTFMKMKGITCDAEGRLKDVFKSGDGNFRIRSSSYKYGESHHVRKKRHFRKSKVTFINYDPNNRTFDPYADDKPGFFVARGLIGKEGLYDHTQETIVFARRTGGFTTLEKEWRRFMVGPIIRNFKEQQDPTAHNP